jgi:hypothetical protein
VLLRWEFEVYAVAQGTARGRSYGKSVPKLGRKSAGRSFLARFFEHKK